MDQQKRRKSSTVKAPFHFSLLLLLIAMFIMFMLLIFNIFFNNHASHYTNMKKQQNKTKTENRKMLCSQAKKNHRLESGKIVREWESKEKLEKLRETNHWEEKRWAWNFTQNTFYSTVFVLGSFGSNITFSIPPAERQHVCETWKNLDMSSKFTLVKRHKTCEEMNQGLYVTLTQFSPRKSRQRKEKKNWKMIWKVFYAGNVPKFCQARLRQSKIHRNFGWHMRKEILLSRDGLTFLARDIPSWFFPLLPSNFLSVSYLFGFFVSSDIFFFLPPTLFHRHHYRLGKLAKWNQY